MGSQQKNNSSMRAWTAVLLAVGGLIVGLLAEASGLRGQVWAQADPVVAAAGDIACDPQDRNFNQGNGTPTACRMKATSDLIISRSPATVLTLGDNQYEDGAISKFRVSYDPTWGRFKPITRPSVGNHEYEGGTPATGYFGYFGAAAGELGKGYYSFDLGAWHLIALNSNCTFVGGCGPGSAQERWLREDLAANASKACILAYWHHPRFSSGPHGSSAAYDAFFRALHDARADLVLVGHDHTYERFAPQNPNGEADPVRGIRQFVVGTGGKNLYRFGAVRPNSEVRNNETYGVLFLTLRAASYDWEFVPEPGKAFTDKGSGTCSPAP